MAIDWGQALADGAVAGGSAFIADQRAQQDDARWLEREKQVEAMRDQTERQRARYLAGLKPPETRKLSTMGADGKPMVQQQEFKLPGADEEAGHFENVGDATPDINYEKLEETQRYHDQVDDAKAASRDMQQRLAEARIDAATARADAAAAKRSGNPVEPKPYTTTRNGQPYTVYGWFDSSGKFNEAKDAEGNSLGGDKFRPSVFAEKRAAQAEGVKGTLRSVASAFGLDKLADVMPTPGSGSSAAPASASASTKAPAPTSGSAQKAPPDGTVLWKGGQKYVVQNGVPVPAP